ILMTGNAVVRRTLIDRVGGFNPALGRVGARLTAGEDADFHQRLLDAGARGYYIPRLVIYHYIPPERLTKRYHRRWCFYRAMAVAQLGRMRPQPVPHLLGIPRYLFGNAARGLVDLIRALARRPRDAERLFSSELPLWDLAGSIVGRYFARSPVAMAATT